jgi:hypothetical protein
MLLVTANVSEVVHSVNPNLEFSWFHDNSNQSRPGRVSAMLPPRKHEMPQA